MKKQSVSNEVKPSVQLKRELARFSHVVDVRKFEKWAIAEAIRGYLDMFRDDPDREVSAFATGVNQQ